MIKSFFRALRGYLLRWQTETSANAAYRSSWLFLAALCGLLAVYAAVASLGLGRKPEFVKLAEQAQAESDAAQREADRQAALAKEEAKKKKEEKPPELPVERKLELRGDKEFRDGVMNGLQIIYTKDAKAFRLFRGIINVIAPSNSDSRYEVVNGIPSLLLAPADVKKSPSWCAGTIARIFAMTYQQVNHAAKSRATIAAPPVPGQEGTSNILSAPVTRPFDYDSARQKAVGYQMKIMKLAGASVQELAEFSMLSSTASTARPDLPFANNEAAEVSFSTSEPVF